jgi:hypothetical protein
MKPTGKGKTIPFILYPFARAHRTALEEKWPPRETEGLYTVLIITPLIALAQTQMAALEAKGVKCVLLREDKGCAGFVLTDCVFIFASPESILKNKARRLAFQDALKDQMINISLIVLDEAHLKRKWVTFRASFQDLLELRSFRGEAIWMIVSATLTFEDRKGVVGDLNLENDSNRIRYFYTGPVRFNHSTRIVSRPEYLVKNSLDALAPYSEALLSLRLECPKFIIFCRSKMDCHLVYDYFYRKMGADMYEPRDAYYGTPLLVKHMSDSDDCVKRFVEGQLCLPHGQSTMRGFICTSTLKTGVDAKRTCFFLLSLWLHCMTFFLPFVPSDTSTFLNSSVCSCCTPDVRIVLHFRLGMDLADLIQGDGRIRGDGECWRFARKGDLTPHDKNASEPVHLKALFGGINGCHKEYVTDAFHWPDVKEEKGETVFFGKFHSVCPMDCCDYCRSQCKVHQCPCKRTTPMFSREKFQVHDDPLFHIRPSVRDEFARANNLGKFKKASRGTPVAAARRAREFKTPN